MIKISPKRRQIKKKMIIEFYFLTKRMDWIKFGMGLFWAKVKKKCERWFIKHLKPFLSNPYFSSMNSLTNNISTHWGCWKVRDWSLRLYRLGLKCLTNNQDQVISTLDFLISVLLSIAQPAVPKLIPFRKMFFCCSVDLLSGFILWCLLWVPYLA